MGGGRFFYQQNLHFYQGKNTICRIFISKTIFNAIKRRFKFYSDYLQIFLIRLSSLPEPATEC
jgi:hypothetical protein